MLDMLTTHSDFPTLLPCILLLATAWFSISRSFCLDDSKRVHRVPLDVFKGARWAAPTIFRILTTKLLLASWILSPVCTVDEAGVRRHFRTWAAKLPNKNLVLGYVRPARPSSESSSYDLSEIIRRGFHPVDLDDMAS